KNNALTPAQREIFATTEQWAAAFLAWQSEIEPGSAESNADRIRRLFHRFTTVPDATVAPASSQSIDTLLSDASILLANSNFLVHTAHTIISTAQLGIVNVMNDISADAKASGKHPSMGTSLWRFFGRTVDYDAHVMIEHGQAALRPFWAAMNSRQRNPQYA